MCTFPPPSLDASLTSKLFEVSLDGFADSVDRFDEVCLLDVIDADVLFVWTFANRPLTRGRLSAKVFRHAYRIFLCPDVSEISLKYRRILLAI